MNAPPTIFGIYLGIGLSLLPLHLRSANAGSNVQ